MRTLRVDKHLGYYTIKYMRHNEGWGLNALSMKSHGLISYPDKVFFNLDAAVEYAKSIAMRMNTVFGTDEVRIKISTAELKHEIIVVSKEVIDELEYDDVPNTEGNNWSRLKRET